MATKLFLRNTTTNGITDTGDGIVYDMLTTAGAAADDDVVTTTSGGSNIQWTQSAGGSTIAFISGRVPAGGFTLDGQVDMSVWALESAMAVNAQIGIRLFRYEPGPTITEISSQNNDGVELGTAITEMTWAYGAASINQAFSENDRFLVRLICTAAPALSMGAGTATIRFNAADAATGDSFVQIAENVTFKAEETTPYHNPNHVMAPIVAQCKRRQNQRQWRRTERGLYVPGKKYFWVPRQYKKVA